jgi:hypothetical protein
MAATVSWASVPEDQGLATGELLVAAVIPSRPNIVARAEITKAVFDELQKFNLRGEDVLESIGEPGAICANP